MSGTGGGLMAVAMTHDEARVWTTGVEPDTRPESIHAPSEMERHHHIRGVQRHHGHEVDHDASAYYESIVRALDDASGVVLIGHGKGKADEMLRFVQYLERKHPGVAERVLGAIDSDVSALSANEVLALVREWFDHYKSLH